MNEKLTLEDYHQKTNLWYNENNIIRENSELYCDFILALLSLIDETYLGSDVVITQDDMGSHFTWCLNKIISNFEHERIVFTPSASTTSYDYVWYFFYKGFYSSDDEDKVSILSEYFSYLFDFSKVKTSRELETFTDFYNIFDKNLKKLN